MSIVKLGAAPLAYPQPVFILGTYDHYGVPNAMNVAWGGVTGKQEITLCCSVNHKTTTNFLRSSCLTVSMGTVETAEICDYLGLVSGNDVRDKVKRCGLHDEMSAAVYAPVFKELPLCFHCKVIDYEPRNGHLELKVVEVTADESILTDGKIDVEKLHPITFDPAAHVYRPLGASVGAAFAMGNALKGE